MPKTGGKLNMLKPKIGVKLTIWNIFFSISASLLEGIEEAFELLWQLQWLGSSFPNSNSIKASWRSFWWIRKLFQKVPERKHCFLELSMLVHLYNWEIGQFLAVFWVNLAIIAHILGWNGLFPDYNSLLFYRSFQNIFIFQNFVTKNLKTYVSTYFEIRA